MSVQAMAKVWEMDLDHSRLIVLLSLADHADHLGGDVFPKCSLTAWKTGYSIASINRIVKGLVEDGILEVVDRPIGYPVEYRIRFENCPKKSPYEGSRKRAGVSQNDIPPTADGVSQNDIGGLSQLRDGGSITAVHGGSITAVHGGSITAVIDTTISNHQGIINEPSSDGKPSAAVGFQLEQEPETKQKPKKKREIETAVMPDQLKTPEVLAEWERFVEYRRRHPRHRAFPTAYAQQMTIDELFRLSKGDPATAISLIQYAVRKNWATVFPIDQRGSTSNPKDIKQHDRIGWQDGQKRDDVAWMNKLEDV